MTPTRKWLERHDEPSLVLLGNPRAVIDANVLAKIRVADLLLRIAEMSGLFYPLWTERILDEVQRTHTTKFKRPWSLETALHFRREVTHSFPLAMVRGYERWIAQCRNEEGDRHVLAAAIESRAPYIITDNLDDFAVDALAPWDVRAVSPDDYLLALHTKGRAEVLAQLRHIGQKEGSREAEVLKKLARHTPKFAESLLKELPE